MSDQERAARPELIAIAAVAEANRAIGVCGHLPWSIPEDLKRFRQLTMGQAVIVGRRTWAGDLRGQPLVGRTTIVVSQTLSTLDGKTASGNGASPLAIARSLAEAIALVPPSQQGFLIGGASIYEQGLPFIDRMELTVVTGDYEGDTFFPDYQMLVPQQFTLTHVDDCGHYRFESYGRTGQLL